MIQRTLSKQNSSQSSLHFLSENNNTITLHYITLHYINTENRASNEILSCTEGLWVQDQFKMRLILYIECPGDTREREREREGPVGEDRWRWTVHCEDLSVWPRSSSPSSPAPPVEREASSHQPELQHLRWTHHQAQGPRQEPGARSQEPGERGLLTPLEGAGGNNESPPWTWPQVMASLDIQLLCSNCTTFTLYFLLI